MKILESLKRADANHRLHHAYVLSGPENPEKMECVMGFLASMSNKQSKEIDLFGAPVSSDSEVLEKIRRGNHPDFVRIHPEEGTIRVEQVRELPRHLAFAPLEAKKRVIVLENAECLNSQASNAVLKILEEPPPHTMFFLLCEEPAGLLPTIQSRCQVMRFPPMPEAAMKEALLKEFPSEEELLRAAVLFGEGSLEKAGRFMKFGDLAKLAAKMLLELWEASPRVSSSILHWADGLEEEEVHFVVDLWTLFLRESLLDGDLFSSLRLNRKEFVDRKRKLSEWGDKQAALQRFRVYREFNGNLKLDFVNLLGQMVFRERV